MSCLRQAVAASRHLGLARDALGLRGVLGAARLHTGRRCMDHSPEEKALADKVLAALPGAKVMVEDVSGGCGSSYNVHVESDVFAGMTRIKQHRLVSGPLKEDMKTIHALRIFTETPKE